MAFKTIPGIEGKVFVPEKEPRIRKHPCQDCFVCQQCGDDRCRLCRVDGPTAPTNACLSRDGSRKVVTVATAAEPPG